VVAAHKLDIGKVSCIVLDLELDCSCHVAAHFDLDFFTPVSVHGTLVSKFHELCWVHEAGKPVHFGEEAC
jgi:hypothetical protein